MTFAGYALLFFWAASIAPNATGWILSLLLAWWLCRWLLRSFGLAR